MQDRLVLGTLVMCILIGVVVELYPDRPRDKWEGLFTAGLALLLAMMGWGVWWLAGRVL